MKASEVPFQPRTKYRPTISSTRCHTCRHPDREGIDFDLSSGKLTIDAISSKYSLSRATLNHHKAHHLAQAIIEASADTAVEIGKKIVGRIVDRATVAHELYRENPIDNIQQGRLALDTETQYLKSTGQWHEQHDISLNGSVQLTAADKADADYLVFMRDVHPEMIAEYEAWAERRLMGEIAPAMLTTDSVQRGDAIDVESSREE